MKSFCFLDSYSWVGWSHSSQIAILPFIFHGSHRQQMGQIPILTKDTQFIPVFVCSLNHPFSLDVMMNGLNSLPATSWPVSCQSPIHSMTVGDWHHIFDMRNYNPSGNALKVVNDKTPHISPLHPRSTTHRPSLCRRFATVETSSHKDR